MRAADIAAEALAFAEEAAGKTERFTRYIWLQGSEVIAVSTQSNAQTTHVQTDIHDAALAHVAERCACLEERLRSILDAANAASQAHRDPDRDERQRDEASDALARAVDKDFCEHSDWWAARGAAEAEDAEKEAGRG